MNRLARWVLGLVFLQAGLSKLHDPWGFAQAVDNYRLLPPAALGLVALFLPALETVVGGTLLLGWLRRGTAWATLGMLLAFELALASALWRGLNISCGCTAGSTTPLWWQLLWDLFLTALALGGLGLFPARSPSAGTPEEDGQHEAQRDSADPASAR